MITAYSGGFLLNVIPLEIALHRCNYGCVYCFSTLNYRHAQYTRCDPPKLFRQLSTFRERQTLVAYLLREGYPVLLSNHTDPFCPANLPLTRQLLATLTALKIPVAYQTKGGIPDELLDTLPPASWYLTITTDNEAIRQRFEPAAPPLAERHALIDKLIQRGHTVTVGVNPYVSDWWVNEGAFVDRLAAQGVAGVWSELLHFHYRQRDHMTPSERAAIGEPLLKTAMQRYFDVEQEARWDQFLASVNDVGIAPFRGGQGVRSAFWERYRRPYAKTYPVIQDFINYCHDMGRDETDLIDEGEFLAFFVDDLPKGKWNEINSYLGSANHDLWWNYKIPNALSYKELLSIYFRNPQVHNNPCNHTGAFAFPLVKQGNDVAWQLDNDGLPVMSFQAQGWYPQTKLFDSDDLAVWFWTKYPQDAPEELRPQIDALYAARREAVARLEAQQGA